MVITRKDLEPVEENAESIPGRVVVKPNRKFPKPKKK